MFSVFPCVQYSPRPPFTLVNVTEDIQLLSQLTPRIRIYGADCNQTALVLQAIQLLSPRGSGSFMIDWATRVSTFVIAIVDLDYL